MSVHLLQNLPYQQNNEKQEKLTTTKLLELIEEKDSSSSSKENEEMAIKIISEEINKWSNEFNCLLNKEFILSGSHLLGGKINKSDIDSILIIHEEIEEIINGNINLIKCSITSLEFFGPEFVDCQNLENGCNHLNKSLYCRFCGYFNKEINFLYKINSRIQMIKLKIFGIDIDISLVLIPGKFIGNIQTNEGINYFNEIFKKLEILIEEMEENKRELEINFEVFN
uniref:NTP_transf_2 domain-containing protein n=1 Tax=Meloidogyne hapla TaxID=6305 RepID=A0A1I8B9B5_MELHA